MVPFHSRGGSGREAGLTRLDDSDNRLVYGGRHTVLLAKTRDRAVDGVDLAAATAMASLAQPRATLQASGLAITSPMVSPVAHVVPENVTFIISFSQTMRCTSSKRLTLKPEDSQILAEACRRWVGRLLRAPNRIISRPL